MATIKKSKTISQLDLFGLSDGDIKNLEIPVQSGDKNFKVLISQILQSVSKTQLGLDLVDNTPDALKPTSLQTQKQLDTKSQIGHQHKLHEVEGLVEKLNEFFTKNDQIPIENLQAVIELLLKKADVIHQHKAEDIGNLQELLAGKAELNHDHQLNNLEGYQDLMDLLTTISDSKVSKSEFSALVEERIQEFAVTYDQPKW